MNPQHQGSGASAPRTMTPGRRLARILARIILYWALFGGFIISGLAVMTAASAASNLVFDKPFAFDYELVQHFGGIAIFTFLPYCQLVGANVTVDIFTENMSDAKKAAMGAFSSLFAVGFSILLLRQMSLGFVSYVQFPQVTPILNLPLWTAFPFILVSLALLLIASILTLIDGWRGMHGQPPVLHLRHDFPIE
jgi:TRAP-type C4-dicarboxylate transport system permease small subunit